MDINDEPFSLYSLIIYIKENIAGLSLLVLAILIIVFVDYISRLNSIIFSTQNSLPIIPLTKNKNRKFKKR